MVGDKPNWFEVAWCGIGDADVITISVTPTHETCKGINENKVLSISLTDENILQRVDYVGIVSGKKVDKSQVFPWSKGELGAPVPEEAPVTMECELIDAYAQHGMHLLICKVKNTYVNDELLDEKQKVDYGKLKPILFEPRFQYLRTGDVVGPAIAPGKAYAAQL